VSNGGNGYLRIMKFHPSTDTIDVLTYSPYLNSYLTDSGNQFTISWHKWTGTGAGSISGVVKDISTCSALVNAAIASNTGSTATNTSGSYVLGGLAPNTYSVVASSGSYVSVGRNIEVGPGMTASGKLFLGTGAGQFQGSATDSTGASISGATIHFVGSASTSAFDETITTNTSGQYASGNIPAGTYQLTASANGFNSFTTTANLGSGSKVAENFVLTPSSGSNGGNTGGTSGGGTSGGTTGGGGTTGATGTITGQIVKDDTAQGLSGATVSYGGGNTLTNSSGVYKLINVPAGTPVTVSAAQPGYGSASSTITLAAGATASLNFSLPPGCTINTTNLTVTICQPTANSIVLNPVHIIAKATDSTPVGHLEVWVDGTTKAYQVNGGSVNAYVSMTRGKTHRITVQAVDTSNHIFKQTVYATVQ